MPAKSRNLKHDIRNPLYLAKNLIETHLEYLETLGDAPHRLAGTHSRKTKLILRKSAKAIDRVLGTIRKLNQIAKNGRGIELPAEQGQSIRVIIALKTGYCLEQLVLVELIPEDLPEIEVSSVDLEEIFFNLISNAAQAMVSGGELTIEAFLQSEPDAAVVISFRDTGCGISEEALPHIFEPFYTGSAAEGGMGFGLYIVKQLVERNGGWVTVESQPNAGTTFTLTFPLSCGSGGDSHKR